jgi:hypothetical protein
MTASSTISIAAIPLGREIISSAMTTVTNFDYSVLDAGVADVARLAAERIQVQQQLTVGVILAIGSELKKVKDALDHGPFYRWLEAEVGWTVRTAQRYMAASDVFGMKPDTVSHLPPAVIYKLAATSTPSPVRDGIVARLDRGERIQPAVISELLDDARARAKQDKAEARLTPRKRRTRARSAAQRKREREEREAENQLRRGRAEVVARELIAEFGAATIRSILDAADDWEIQDALRRAVREPL